MAKHSKQKNSTENNTYKKLHYYIGIPHCHTSYSTGKGTPEEAFKMAEENGLNFIIITDHSNSLRRMTTYKKTAITKWEAIKKAASHYNKKHQNFCAMYGFECIIKRFGEVNVLNTHSLARGTMSGINTLTSLVENEDKHSIIINHPGSILENLKYGDPSNSLFNAIEVGNGSPPFKYKRYENIYFSLLDRGCKLAAVNGQDNHAKNWGCSDNLTVILAKHLSADSITDALRNRRTYSTESKTLKLLFFINNTCMGGTIEDTAETSLHFSIYASDNKIPIQKILLISNGGEVIKTIISPEHCKNQFTIDCSSLHTWYVIKVIQVENRISISSPIFVKDK